LAVAIRTGIDPTGRNLSALMPRYDLNDEEMGSLIAYLKGLGVRRPAGVDDRDIHFATVVGPDVLPAQKEAMLHVIDTFVDECNIETRRYLARFGTSPRFKGEMLRGYRRWVMHTWNLHGPPQSHADQLEALYAERPVFALLSGIARDSWRPIHEFCHRHELPCLFPNTDMPMAGADSGYTLYLSRGLSGAAAVLASHLQRDEGKPTARGITQVYRSGSAGAEVARVFRECMQVDSFSIRDLVVRDARLLNTQLRSERETVEPGALILWLDESELRSADLGETTRIMGKAAIYIAAGSVEQPLEGLEEWLPEHVSIVFPFETPDRRVPQLYRVRSWMYSRRIPPPHEIIRLNTYFALSVTAHSMEQMIENYSRDYLVEKVEHETENALNPGSFPRLSLGPGQRYASKCSYILRIPRGGDQWQWSPGEWIVP
jgi:hypothetical protein